VKVEMKPQMDHHPSHPHRRRDLIAAKCFRADSKQLTASGTLEARNIEVGSKVGGRILRVLGKKAISFSRIICSWSSTLTS